MNVPIPLLASILICHIIGLFLVVKWIYDDAKAREMSPWLWMCLTAFLSPNFIGLIVYLVFRRKDTEIACSSCGGLIDQSMNYCYWCGSENKLKNKNLPEKPSNTFLVIGVVIMILCISTLLASIFMM